MQALELELKLQQQEAQQQQQQKSHHRKMKVRCNAKSVLTPCCITAPAWALSELWFEGAAQGMLKVHLVLGKVWERVTEVLQPRVRAFATQLLPT